MNVIKKYWTSVYKYVLLLVPGFCMCAGVYFSSLKLLGFYPDLAWAQILLFDCSQLVYLGIALFFIWKNRKNSAYIPTHLRYVKGYTVVILFIQYNMILYLFPSSHLWECTFLFFAVITFLFDSKLMILNTICYFFSLVIAHLLWPAEYLPLADKNVGEILAYRILIYWLTAICIIVIVYSVEHFLIQAQESTEENVILMEKQLEYYQDMELLDTELRKFRHDVTNHFICMESLLNNGKIDDLHKYFEEYRDSFSFSEKKYFSGNEIVDAILNHDVPHYCAKEVKVTAYGALPKIDTVSAIDMCTLFSNLLSNAITAANQCIDIPDAQINIHFSGGKQYFSIVMSNSILSQNSIQTKGKNHGFGVRKIRNVLEKYNGKYEMDIEEQTFIMKIYLPI